MDNRGRDGRSYKNFELKNISTRFVRAKRFRRAVTGVAGNFSGVPGFQVLPESAWIEYRHVAGASQNQQVFVTAYKSIRLS